MRNIRDKILHVLKHYPVLSPSMLQVGIGPSISPRAWHPVLDSLVQENIVQKSERGVEDPSGRYRSITLIQLVPNNS